MRDTIRQGGFTLVELMVTVVILGILTAIAVPSYRDYVIRAALGDAMSNLATKRVQNEQWFQDNRSYIGAPGCEPDYASSNNPSSKYFNFSCTPNPTATSYTLLAEGVGGGITANFRYTLDQTNTKKTLEVPSGWNIGDQINRPCWVSKRSGC